MSNNSITQLRLAGDPNFKDRLRGAFLAVAVNVLFEDPGTANHTARAAFAATIIGSPDQLAQAVNQFAPLVAMRGNIIAYATSYNFDIPAVVSATGDADIQSQLNTDWNILAATFQS